MFSLISLVIWLRWEQAGSGGMLTLTSLTILLHWELACSSGSGFPGRGETGFAASMLVAVDLPSLVAVDLNL